MAHAEEEELAMMRGEGPPWPLGFLLPLVNRQEPGWKAGVLIAGEGPIILRRNVYAPSPEGDKLDEVEEHETFQSIYDAGWRVD